MYISSYSLPLKSVWTTYACVHSHSALLLLYLDFIKRVKAKFTENTEKDDSSAEVTSSDLSNCCQRWRWGSVLLYLYLTQEWEKNSGKSVDWWKDGQKPEIEIGPDKPVIGTRQNKPWTIFRQCLLYCGWRPAKTMLLLWGQQCTAQGGVVWRDLAVVNDRRRGSRERSEQSPSQGDSLAELLKNVSAQLNMS